MNYPILKLTRQFVCLLLVASIGQPAYLHSDPGDLDLSWGSGLAIQGEIFSSPAIGPTGTVIFGTRSGDPLSGTESGKVYFINPDGTRKTDPFTGPDWIDSSPAVSADGRIYIGCWNNQLYALEDQTGSVVWQFNCNAGDAQFGDLEGAVVATPAIGPDGTIYIGSTNGRMFAIGQDGSKDWHYETDPDLLRSIYAGAILNTSGDTLYFGDNDGKFHALNADTGLKRWTYSVPVEHDLSFRPGERAIYSAAALDSNGNVFFTCANGYLYMLSPTGTLLNSYSVSDSILNPPVIDAENRVYFSSRDTYLYCVQQDTQGVLSILWEALVGDVLYSSAVIDDLGNIIVAAYSGSSISGDSTTVHAFDASGQAQWVTASVPTINDASLNLAPVRDLYLGGYDGKMYKFEGTAPLATAGWPRNGANRRQTGWGPDLFAFDLVDYFPEISHDSELYSHVPWFGSGYTRAMLLPTIEHIDHGILTVAESSESGIITYDYDLTSWTFFFSSHPDILYLYNSKKWLFHVRGTSVDDERWFFDFALREWKTASEVR